MPYDLFISYSRRDDKQGQVRALKAQIEADYRNFAAAARFADGATALAAARLVATAHRPPAPSPSSDRLVRRAKLRDATIHVIRPEMSS
jgi:hypothetical protein